MHHLFISYSRKDRAFVERLSAALKDRQKHTWVDWKDIPPTAEFLNEIRHAIVAADRFVFVISPDSCRSRTCRLELTQAATSRKRLIPILYRPVQPNEIPAELAPLNWISFDEANTFETSLTRLITAMETDLQWVRAHTELGVRATQWDERGRKRTALLRGEELTAVER